MDNVSRSQYTNPLDQWSGDLESGEIKAVMAVALCPDGRYKLLIDGVEGDLLSAIGAVARLTARLHELAAESGL